MALPHSMTTISSAQVGPGLTEVKAILNSVDATALLERLRLYRWTGSRWRGRSGYSVEALWRAVLLSYILNIPSTSALIRRLQEESRLRRICGFKALPHRSTFSRSFSRVSLHLDLVQLATTTATDRLRDYLPNLRDKVAVDSTVVSSYSNPNRHPISDPEASWTAKTSTRPGAKNGTEWSFGYKLHVVADAEHGIPLWGILTTASRNDVSELPTLIDGAAGAYPWFRPGYVIGDKGYDSQANHRYVIAKGAVPVIHIRRARNSGLQDGIYTNEGVPTCVGNQQKWHCLGGCRSVYFKSFLYNIRCIICLSPTTRNFPLCLKCPMYGAICVTICAHKFATGRHINCMKGTHIMPRLTPPASSPHPGAARCWLHNGSTVSVLPSAPQNHRTRGPPREPYACAKDRGATPNTAA